MDNCLPFLQLSSNFLVLLLVEIVLWDGDHSTRQCPSGPTLILIQFLNKNIFFVFIIYHLLYVNFIFLPHTHMYKKHPFLVQTKTTNPTNISCIAQYNMMFVYIIIFYPLYQVTITYLSCSVKPHNKYYILDMLGMWWVKPRNKYYILLYTLTHYFVLIHLYYSRPLSHVILILY